MSAAELRKAASLMRKRAEGARAGRWSIAASSLTPDGHLVVAEWEHEPKRVATCSGSLDEGNLLNAEHIASWHPAVALAVADLLDGLAADEWDPAATEEALHTLSRAYLGTHP